MEARSLPLILWDNVTHSFYTVVDSSSVVHLQLMEKRYRNLPFFGTTKMKGENTEDVCF